MISIPPYRPRSVWLPVTPDPPTPAVLAPTENLNRKLINSGSLRNTLEYSGGLQKTLEDSKALWNTLEVSGSLWKYHQLQASFLLSSADVRGLNPD